MKSMLITFEESEILESNGVDFIYFDFFSGNTDKKEIEFDNDDEYRKAKSLLNKEE